MEATKAPLCQGSRYLWLPFLAPVLDPGSVYQEDTDIPPSRISSESPTFAAISGKFA